MADKFLLKKKKGVDESYNLLAIKIKIWIHSLNEAVFVECVGQISFVS